MILVVVSNYRLLVSLFRLDSSLGGFRRSSCSHPPLYKHTYIGINYLCVALDVGQIPSIKIITAKIDI